MSNPDLAIYWVHTAFWSTFGLTRVILRLRDRNTNQATDPAPVSKEEHTARFSRALLACHAVAVGVMYFGIGIAVVPGHVPILFSGQRVVGALVIAGGAALMASAL